MQAVSHSSHVSALLALISLVSPTFCRTDSLSASSFISADARLCVVVADLSRCCCAVAAALVRSPQTSLIRPPMNWSGGGKAAADRTAAATGGHTGLQRYTAARVTLPHRRGRQPAVSHCSPLPCAACKRSVRLLRLSADCMQAGSCRSSSRQRGGRRASTSRHVDTALSCRPAVLRLQSRG